MTIKILTSLTASIALLFASCAAGPNTQRGALGGAAAGAIGGAIIGNNIGDGNAGRGALIGGALGAAGGAVLGNQEDRRQGYVR
jgi:uncharacterized protein YcfJ